MTYGFVWCATGLDGDHSIGETGARIPTEFDSFASLSAMEGWVKGGEPDEHSE